MVKSIHFKVVKWQYNNKATLVNTRTDVNLLSHPLRKNDANSKAEGIGFKWILVITANNIEVLYYSTEEMVIITDKNISETDLKDVIKETYRKASLELVARNLVAGLNAGFPDFDTITTIDVKEIKKVLDM